MRAPPMSREHNRSAPGELLGLSDDQTPALYAAGLTSDAPVM